MRRRQRRIPRGDGLSRPRQGLLGDTAGRDYSAKLSAFNAHAEPELRQAIASLALRPGMRVVDVGCGSGDNLALLGEASDQSLLIGFDLAAAHAVAAKARNPPAALIAQADLRRAPLARASVDLIWCMNTINHVHEPTAALAGLAELLRPGGRIALAQSAFLPEMYFAWDARLERLVTEAVRQYYRERYGVDERRLTAVRALVGLLRAAGLGDIRARTLMIERIAPLKPADERYLAETVFRDTWGERLRPYLQPEDYQEVLRLTDPQDPAYALRRPDFHYLQSLTLVVAAI
ncbi:MAG TPA: methyltransferase domain-containing protein [Steroidobacteraceae bacterium]|jgi:SAM-dependent methyltransferase|nr:methyltransferase domain-containing protein [Steroidobacteraceae bacterium]